MNKFKMKTGKYKGIKIPCFLFLAAVLLNIIGWNSQRFCDWYVENIFPFWVETYGRITGCFSFSIGEWLLYLAVLLICILLLWSIWEACKKILKRTKDQSSKYYVGYVKFIIWTVGIVSLLMTFTCFLTFHVSPIYERYLVGTGTEREYGLAEIEVLRDYVVTRVNALAQEMERDENGYLVYNGDLKEQAKKQMRRMGNVFPALKGYYPNPKPLYTSDFFSQQYMTGYYFPFSMEANYNAKMYVINMPTTMCHELSHLKGFLYEDEANFIAYLACVNSGDPFFEYSAYMSILYYLDSDFYEATGQNAAYYYQHPVISDQVIEDDKFLTPEAWEEVEKDAVFDTEFVKAASDMVVETNLTINGVEDGKISYSRVVDLLLRYYDGILY